MQSEAKREESLGRKLACIVMLLAFTYGCQSIQLPLYEPQPVDNYKNRQIKDGLVVAIHPMLDREESKKYFGTDLLANNILPAYVIGQNRHASSSFMLLRDRITLSAGQLEATRAPDKATSAAGGETLAWTSVAVGFAALPVGIIGSIVAMKQIADASETNRHFKAQEFQTRTLSPGQIAQGFVYFQLPKDAHLPAQWTIHLETLKAVNKEVTRFEFLFASEGGAK